jgi:hypothetical protein
VSTHGLNTQRMSAVQKVWSSYVYATILLQHGPFAAPPLPVLAPLSAETGALGLSPKTGPNAYKHQHHHPHSLHRRLIRQPPPSLPPTTLCCLPSLPCSKASARPRQARPCTTSTPKVPPCKFKAGRAAPFQSWAGVPPGHLYKKLPPLFGQIIEASSNEQHHLVTGFFCQLERLNSQTFAGFQPTDDLVDSISRLKLAPPQGYSTKWHRGIGPMAFADRSLNNIDKKTENRDLRNTYGDHLTLLPWLTRRSWSLPLPSYLLTSKRFSSYCIGLTTST